MMCKTLELGNYNLFCSKSILNLSYFHIGEGFYLNANPLDKKAKPIVTCKGPRQRMHKTTVGEDGSVTVELTTEGKFESDYYSSEEYHALMSKTSL